MVFGTILTGGQQVTENSNSKATGTAILDFNEAKDTLSYELTVYGLDFGAYTEDETPQTKTTSDDVTGIDFGYAPMEETGELAFGVVGIDGDDDLTFTPNPDGSTTITGVWEESDSSDLPLSDFLPDLENSVETTSEDETPQVSDLYLNISTVGDSKGAIRGQIASITPELEDSLSTIDPIALNGLIEQDIEII